jgi:FkbM family methyltransferase
MKVNLSGEFTQFLECLDDINKVVVWGAGMCADDFFAYYKEHTDAELQVDYYVDKNDSKWNQTNIFSTEKIKELHAENDLVLIATQYTQPVLESLENMGFPGKVFSVFNIIYKSRWGDTSEIESHLNELKAILADDKSKWLVEEICRKRKNLDADYSKIYEGHQYFVEELVQREPEAVFVDAGAYDGQTIQQFIDFQENKFKKVYAFEMNEKNFKRIQTLDFDKRVELYNLGLWNEKTTCAYSQDEDSSSLGAGDYIAECITLDEVVGDEPVTFIKMDIEGAEIPALNGAKKCIQKWKPQLAICIYHKQNDLWQIPFLVHEMVPEYKLYVRHHMHDINETVLYATL